MTPLEYAAIVWLVGLAASVVYLGIRHTDRHFWKGVLYTLICLAVGLITGSAIAELLI